MKILLCNLTWSFVIEINEGELLPERRIIELRNDELSIQHRYLDEGWLSFYN